jgi:hypothetical protein
MKIIKNKDFEFNEDDFIWRYLDLYKFFSFIINKKLFFARLDKFEDPLEGLTEKIIGNMAMNGGIPENEEDLKFPTKVKQKILKERQNRVQFVKTETQKYQKTQFANCWFVGKKESFAMWNLYSNNNNVAIRYNPKELVSIVLPSAESYKHSDFNRFIYGFVDYDNIWPFDFNKKEKVKIEWTAFKKDLSYFHEKEFRFVVTTPENCLGVYDSFELPLGDIYLDNFKIYANPYMDFWKYETLKQLLANFKLQDKLMKSSLKVKKE